ncbi:hypothetical protein EIP91_001756 [Steccherinum ochraceum]|uniref:Uncharacterized protein n=1 Tax=Steccherinum ochraceum TaxID=92696 RepID=A0A4R0RU13_9APHY|nr:hypothetical protein EIP91_001756 [Steccherinum ochraceum]
MASPSHRPAVSVSSTNLAPPGPSPITKQRRMTSPSLPPPPSPLNLPEPVYGHRRPPSPLRNGVSLDGEASEDGSSDSEESPDAAAQWRHRSSSPSPSVAQFAANIAQRMNSIMSNISRERSPNHLPTDEELEAEAERERERSRREAELIMSREAETRRLEERVLAMLETDTSNSSLPPPPPLSQGDPSTPPSPSNSQKGSWWSTAKNKLTPTKDLTPAQQIIQESKAREKEMEAEKKEIEKERKHMEKEMKKLAKKHEKKRSKEWPSSPENKFDDPAFLKLGAPSAPRPRQMSSPSPSPMRQGTYSTPPSLTASPLRLQPSEGSSASPSKQAPPLYAQFNAQGTLDMPGTLLVIAGRFEKLERWTVSHVRALEERMDDVERWLVDKEGENEKDLGKERTSHPQAPVETQQTDDPNTAQALSEVREELAEVQGRIGELGREMARMVSAPGNLASGPSRNGASVNRAPSTTSSIAVRSISNSMVSTPRTTPTTKDTTSPPVVTTPPPLSRTRLPYPTGDYATPPDSNLMHQGPFSPPHSPPLSLSIAGRSQMSIPGLPLHSGEAPSTGTSPSGLPPSASPVEPASPPSLPVPPNRQSQRTASVSPTPRKRYTVALGGPIMAPARARERSHSRNQSRDFGGPISTSPLSATFDETSASDSDGNPGANEETIGKAAARTAGLNIPNKISKKDFDDTSTYASDSSSSLPTTAHIQPKRARPQSMYSGPASAQNILAPTPTTPLNTRLRSQSTDRFGLGFLDETPTTPGGSGRFVDPLQIRRQTKEMLASAAPAPPKVMTGKPKVPVGRLVAFFDQGEK